MHYQLWSEEEADSRTNQEETIVKMYLDPERVKGYVSIKEACVILFNKYPKWYFESKVKPRELIVAFGLMKLDSDIRNVVFTLSFKRALNSFATEMMIGLLLNPNLTLSHFEVICHMVSYLSTAQMVALYYHPLFSKANEFDQNLIKLRVSKKINIWYNTNTDSSSISQTISQCIPLTKGLVKRADRIRQDHMLSNPSLTFELLKYFKGDLGAYRHNPKINYRFLKHFDMTDESNQLALGKWFLNNFIKEDELEEMMGMLKKVK